MMLRYRFLAYMFLGVALLFSGAVVHADCFNNTVNFNPNQGYIYNNSWTHCLSGLPPNCVIESAEITVRAQVWYWGWYPYVQDILCSDTNVFNYSEGYVCTLTSSTHPNSGNFYTITCTLNQEQIEWLLNDGCINFQMVTFGGTYYLDYSTLEVCCAEVPECKGDFDLDGDVDGSDLAVFAADFGRTDCDTGDPCEGDFDKDGDVDGSDLAVFASDFGRTDCPH